MAVAAQSLLVRFAAASTPKRSDQPAGQPARLGTPHRGAGLVAPGLSHSGLRWGRRPSLARSGCSAV